MLSFIYNKNLHRGSFVCCAPWILCCFQQSLDKMVQAKLVNAILCFLSVCYSSNASSVKRQGCGGAIAGTSGTFTSPNFPSNYPNDASCTWTIQAPAGASRIDLTFTTLDIEWGSSCEWDYLVVKDKAGHQVGSRLCGRPGNTKITVPGDTAVVVFTSDNAANEKGFQATFVAATPLKPPAVGNCNFDKGLCPGWVNLNTDDQFDWTLHSGSTPSALTGPTTDHSGNGKYAYIESTGQRHGDSARLATPPIPGPRCMKFYYHQHGIVGMGRLRVYVVTSGGKRLVMSLNGDQGNQWKVATVQIDDSQPYQVVFEGTVGQSDYSDIAIDDVTFSKDRCVGTSGCGGILTGSKGVFTSPKFPDRYPDNARCTWTIKPSSPISLVIIKFKTFKVEKEPRCSDDYVIISDQAGSPVRQPRFCGFYPEGFGLKVRGEEATVYFHSNGHLRRQGFSATYESVPMSSIDDCDFDNGLCSTWHNAKNDDFDWSIGKGRTPSFYTGPHRDVFALGGYAFTEASNRRAGDKALLVSSLISGETCLSFSYHLHGREMGALRVLVTSSQGTRMLWTASGDHGTKWLRTSVNLKEAGNYQITFEGQVGSTFTSDMALDEISFSKGQCPQTKECDAVLTGVSGVITSPNYPLPYPSNTDCAWTIIPPPRYDNIAITFHELELESSPTCSKDHLLVEDITGTKIEEKICGSEGQANRTVTLDWHQAKLHFHSDGAVVDKGFRASYRALGNMPACGGQLSGHGGDFKTPNYPNHYPLREICDWEITGPPGTTKIAIQFEDFAIDDAAVTCSYNYLEVYDAQHGRPVGKYCGMTRPLPIVVDANVINVRFHSAHFGAARGFFAHFKAV